ncbi:mucin-5AC-like isoform X1 [Cimex lectularius]|nr:mucin-5AC-like isoform X1 [Cimex lectularius]
MIGFSRVQNLSRYPTNTTSLFNTIPNSTTMFSPFPVEKTVNATIFVPPVSQIGPTSCSPLFQAQQDDHSPKTQYSCSSSNSPDNISNPQVLNPVLPTGTLSSSSSSMFKPVQNSSTGASVQPMSGLSMPLPPPSNTHPYNKTPCSSSLPYPSFQKRAPSVLQPNLGPNAPRLFHPQPVSSVFPSDHVPEAVDSPGAAGLITNTALFPPPSTPPSFTPSSTPEVTPNVSDTTETPKTENPSASAQGPPTLIPDGVSNFPTLGGDFQASLTNTQVKQEQSTATAVSEPGAHSGSTPMQNASSLFQQLQPSTDVSSTAGFFSQIPQSSSSQQHCDNSTSKPAEVSSSAQLYFQSVPNMVNYPEQAPPASSMPLVNALLTSPSPDDAKWASSSDASTFPPPSTPSTFPTSSTFPPSAFSSSYTSSTFPPSSMPTFPISSSPSIFPSPSAPSTLPPSTYPSTLPKSSTFPPSFTPSNFPPTSSPSTLPPASSPSTLPPASSPSTLPPSSTTSTSSLPSTNFTFSPFSSPSTVPPPSIPYKVLPSSIAPAYLLPSTFPPSSTSSNFPPPSTIPLPHLPSSFSLPSKTSFPPSLPTVSNMYGSTEPIQSAVEAVSSPQLSSLPSYNSCFPSSSVAASSAPFLPSTFTSSVPLFGIGQTVKSSEAISNGLTALPTISNVTHSFPPSPIATSTNLPTSVMSSNLTSISPQSTTPSTQEYSQITQPDIHVPSFMSVPPSSTTSRPPLLQPYPPPLQTFSAPPKDKNSSLLTPLQYNKFELNSQENNATETDSKEQSETVDEDELEQIPLEDTVPFYNPASLNIHKALPKEEIGNTFRLKSGLKRPTYAPVPDLEIAHQKVEPMTQAAQSGEETGKNTSAKIEPMLSEKLNSPELVRPSSDSRHSSTSETVTLSAVGAEQMYNPPYHHWFFKKGGESKAHWQPFSRIDSLNLEQAFLSNITQETTVSTDGGRYDVEVLQRRKKAVYWEEPVGEVRRCSWFVKTPIDGRYIPYDENIAELIEGEYREGCLKNEWNRRVELADGEVIILHSPNAMAHHQRSSSPDTWGNAPPMQQKPKIVKRGLDDIEIAEGEPEQVDHLLLVVHGIGKGCDLRFRTLVPVVDDFRAISLQLVQSHFKTASNCGNVGRIEILPVEWHRALHTEVIDQRLAGITLPSIPKAREFTNETLLDILFYTSPVFCEKIVQAVGAELNRVYNLYLQRNPNFKGGVSISGHSLGSLILFDMLSNQRTTVPTPVSQQSAIPEDEDMPELGCLKTKAKVSRRMSYLTIGSTGAGQPYIVYPQLHFQPQVFIAFGSPIGMFVTVRGIESLGKDFKFPTCQRFFNIFHPNDPVAYRIEPLISPEMSGIPAVMIPHHKGRKRMHLELKETMAHVTAALKQKLMDSVRSTWNTVYQLAMFQRPDSSLQHEVDKVLQDEVLRGGDVSSPTGSFQLSLTDEQGLELRVGSLNGGNRIDYVLQEAPLETFNQYISAVRSHVVYWESEDTVLMVLKEIYKTMGISADVQLPQQILPFDISSDDNSEYTDNVNFSQNQFSQK